MAGARKFSKVSPALWSSSRFMGLPNAHAQLLHCYFMTGPHTTSAGAYRIKQAYALADLGWHAKQYNEALQALISADLVAYDSALETIYVRRWFQHNPPCNDKHAEGTRRLILQLESKVIAALAMNDLEEAERLRKPQAQTLEGIVSASLRATLEKR